MFKKLSITILHEINNHLIFIPGITQIIEIQIQYLKCFIKHSYTFISFSKFLLQLFKWIRDCQKKRKSRLSSKHLKKIPIKKFKKGENPKLLDVFTFHRLYWEINQCTGFSWSIKRTWTFFFYVKIENWDCSRNWILKTQKAQIWKQYMYYHVILSPLSFWYLLTV